MMANLSYQKNPKNRHLCSFLLMLSNLRLPKTPRRSMCEAMEEIIHELAKVL